MDLFSPVTTFAWINFNEPMILYVRNREI